MELELHSPNLPAKCLRPNALSLAQRTDVMIIGQHASACGYGEDRTSSL